MTDGIGFVEAHDATIGSLRLSPEGRCRIAFSHLAVYYRTTPEAGEEEAFEIWSCPAELILEGASEVRCEGPVTGDPVMDGEAFGPDGQQVPWVRLRDHSAVTRLELQLFGGTKIAITCEGAELVLGERKEYLERWSGPL